MNFLVWYSAVNFFTGLAHVAIASKSDLAPQCQLFPGKQANTFFVSSFNTSPDVFTLTIIVIIVRDCKY